MADNLFKLTVDFPPVGYVFIVQILGSSSSDPSSIEAGFQEVSGITAEMSTEKITEGGENRFVHTVPSRINNSDLVLKRGLIVSSSEFGKWCREHFKQGLNTVKEKNRIDVKDLIVHLLDVDTKKPIMSWAFAGAYPIKWEISGLNAKQSEIVVESLTLTYRYFSVF